ARTSHEMFKQLSGRIDNIMEVLDNQIGLTEKLDTGVKEVAAVQKKIAEPDEPAAIVPAASAPEAAGPQHAGSPPPLNDSSALKKAWEYRILMINIVKKEHGFMMKDLQSMMSDNAGLVQEHLPGHPACSFSKWINHS